jgi:hypothetical protein
MTLIRYACIAGIFVAANSAANDEGITGLVPSYLPANRVVSMNLCDPSAANIPHPHYFHFAFSMPTGTTHSYTPAATPGGGVVAGDTVNLLAGTECQATTVFTSGVATSSNALVIVSSCYDYRPGGSRTCSGAMGMYTFITPIAPTVSVNPSAPLQIGFTGIPVTREETVTLNPNIATLAVNAACTAQNGAIASVAPLSTGSNVTDDSGQARFNLTASIGTPVPGLAPSATCTFTVPLATNGANVAVQVQAPVYQPTLTVVSPPMPIGHPGQTDVVLQISPSYAGVQVDATCTANLATVSLNAPNRLTNSQGRAAFTVTAQDLAVVHPNLAVVPSASCTFKVHGGTGTATATFNTGNACAFGLRPAPAGCGNP